MNKNSIEIVRQMQRVEDAIELLDKILYNGEVDCEDPLYMGIRYAGKTRDFKKELLSYYAKLQQDIKGEGDC